MSKSDLFLLFCLAFVAGIFGASFFFFSKTIDFKLIIVFLIIGFLVGGVFYSQKIARTIAFCLIVFALGFWFFQAKFLALSENILIQSDEKNIVLTGVIIRNPQPGYNNLKIIVSVRKIINEAGEEIWNQDQELGKAIIYTNNYFNFEYYDLIEAKGIARVPKKLDNFDYQGYLMKEDIVLTMAYPEITRKENQDFGFFSFLSKQIFSLKEKMRDQIQKNMPPREASVLEAMILGESSAMPEELKQKLSQTGLSHAIAISGTHIVLFSAIAFEILLFFGFWKKQAAAVSIILIILYVIMAGAMASAVRSGIMGCLLMLARLFDRTTYSERTLCLAGFLILLQNPLALKYDLGFQLSFLAIAGLIFGLPILRSFFSRQSERFKTLKEIIFATLSAQIATLPLLAFNFGYISTISLLSNLLVISLLPGLMILGLFFPLIGIIIPFLGSFFAFFCFWLVRYLLFIIDFSAQIPLAVLNFQISGFVAILIYLLFVVIILKYRKKSDFIPI
jgi:competence protein ComEC